jgi:hypothetical protein
VSVCCIGCTTAEGDTRSAVFVTDIEVMVKVDRLGTSHFSLSVLVGMEVEGSVPRPIGS